MSFNVGESCSKFVAVSNLTLKLDYSDKVVFADLRTSRKTGKPKIDKETGKPQVNKETGEIIPERTYSTWEGRFVGSAMESAKGLKRGSLIDIVQGWIDKEEFIGRDGKTKFTNYFVTISDYRLSDMKSADSDIDDNEVTQEENSDNLSFLNSINGDESVTF